MRNGLSVSGWEGIRKVRSFGLSLNLSLSINISLNLLTLYQYFNYAKYTTAYKQFSHIVSQNLSDNDCKMFSDYLANRIDKEIRWRKEVG